MKRKAARKILIVIIWIAIWQIVSVWIHKPLVMASPLETLTAFGTMVREKTFYRSILGSLGRVALGFIVAFIPAVLIAALASAWSFLEDFLRLPVMIMKAVPVAAFVVLALLWMGSQNLSVLISAIMVFPVIYTNVLEGIHSVSPDLLEVARVYHMSLKTSLRYIYLPALKPFVCSAVSLAAGICWKAGVAAEVISTPEFSVGYLIYQSKIYLETDRLFVWIIVLALIGNVCERLLIGLMNRLVKKT